MLTCWLNRHPHVWAFAAESWLCRHHMKVANEGCDCTWLRSTCGGTKQSMADGNKCSCWEVGGWGVVASGQYQLLISLDCSQPPRNPARISVHKIWYLMVRSIQAVLIDFYGSLLEAVSSELAYMLSHPMTVWLIDWLIDLSPVGVWGHLQGENIHSYIWMMNTRKPTTVPYSFWQVARDLLTEPGL